MSTAEFVTRLPVLLRPNPARVVIRPYMPTVASYKYAAPDRPRAQRIADRVLALDATALHEELERILQDFSGRHRDVSAIFRQRFREVEGIEICKCHVTDDQAVLIGAHFCNEYSYEAAALFNPSIVAHPDQTDIPAGSSRFVLSLRAVGEGHVSSVTFRTGVVSADGAVAINPPSPRPVVLSTEVIEGNGEEKAGARITCDGSHDLSEIVIFPTTPSQRSGIEDVRLVRFLEDDGVATFYGTYTAFSGQSIRQELLSTPDFRTFDLKPLNGDATASKGMALFPRRVGGKFAMLGREDNESIWFLQSDDLYQWDGGAKLVEPRWPWEFVQIGNCGSPLEIDEGWLVVTHGVGAVRNYCIGACLLDRNDPSKLLARTTLPVVRSDMEEREGYVPNVAYSCGSMVHGRTLILPHAVADSFTTFATVPLDKLIAAMK